MKKRIAQLLFVVLTVSLMSGCGLLKKKTFNEKQKQNETVEQEEVVYSIDVARYKAYVKVLKKIIDDNKWPDGTAVVPEYDHEQIEENSFAISDIDQDGKEELLVQISATSAADMIAYIFDYDEDSKKVVSRWMGAPAFDVYENGAICDYSYRNQTGSDKVWPFALHQYDVKKEKYIYIGSAHSVEEEWSMQLYNEEEDTDKDGIIYYILEGDSIERKAHTKKEYEKWLYSYLGGAEKLFIPWERLWDYNVEGLASLTQMEGVVKPILLGYDESIVNYDFTGDGKKDVIEIECDEVEDDSYGITYGTEWSIELNGKEVLEVESDWMVELEVWLYRVSNRRSYLLVKQNLDTNDDISGVVLYRVTEDDIKVEHDFYDYITDNINVFHNQIDISYMSANEMALYCSNQFNATAGMVWEMKYEYDKEEDKWVEVDPVYTILYEEWTGNKKDGMTANQSFKVYKNYDGKEEAYTVNEGDVLKLEAIRFYKGETYFKAKNSKGVEGWFVDPEEAVIEKDGNWIEGYFEEAMFAG